MHTCVAIRIYIYACAEHIGCAVQGNWSQNQLVVHCRVFMEVGPWSWALCCQVAPAPRTSMISYIHSSTYLGTCWASPTQSAQQWHIARSTLMEWAIMKVAKRIHRQLYKKVLFCRGKALEIKFRRGSLPPPTQLLE